ncbi:MAG: hypothetical protein ACYTFY_21630 [Planctomycetota bacterium]|jgi:hypothetical protein
MKKVLFICLIVMLITSLSAKEQTPESMANSIIQQKLALSPRVGIAKPGDDVFLYELDINLYQAALESKDKRIKALVAIKALRDMPHIVKSGEYPISEV